jgi:hypothetical protein
MGECDRDGGDINRAMAQTAAKHQLVRFGLVSLWDLILSAADSANSARENRASVCFPVLPLAHDSPAPHLS